MPFIVSLHYVCEAYGDRPSVRMGIDDSLLALAYDAEVLMKARSWEKDETDKIVAGGGKDSKANAATLHVNSKERYDEWMASLPDGHELKVKHGGIGG